MESSTKNGQTDETPTTFRLGYVPGVTPAKWVNLWKQRRAETPIELIQLDALDAGASIRSHKTNASLVRLPVDRDGLHAIELYRETSVVVFPKDHHFAAADQLSIADLSDEVLQYPLDCPLAWEQLPGLPAFERVESTKMALEVVAAGVGVVVVPQSLARLHHRKDLTYLPIEGAPLSPIALVWEEFDDNPDIEEFVGIVRGRSSHSSRATRSNPEQQKQANQETEAAQKAERAARVAEKQKRLAQSGSKTSRTGGTRAGSGRGKSGTSKSGGKAGTARSSKSITKKSGPAKPARSTKRKGK